MKIGPLNVYRSLSLSMTLALSVLIAYQFPLRAEEASKSKYKRTFIPKRKTALPEKETPKKTTVPEKSTPAKTVQVEKKPVNSKNVATLETMRNNVEVKSGSGTQWKKADKNAPLKQDDTIRTGSRSLARVKLEDGSRILLLQNSAAELENISSVEKAINLVSGRIRAIVKKIQASGTFKIKTPIGVASVRGTDFEVEYDDGVTTVRVNSGEVGVAKLGELDKEVTLLPGQEIKFKLEGELRDPVQTGSVPQGSSNVRNEVIVESVKNKVLAQAAEELRTADYQVGKSLIDVDGRRVRVEEYITRPQPNQFKLVSLNHRDTRFDYFTYTGTFNQVLPVDLNIALRQMGGMLGATAPDYYLTNYEMFMSNTLDTITDTGSGGHLVKITFDGTTYTLDDGLGNTKNVTAAVLLGDGSYRVYNPIADKFSLVSAANLAAAGNFAILDNGRYRNYAAGDTYWRTRYNSNTFSINGSVKSSYAAKTTVTNVLALDLDADFTNAPITSASEFPSGTGSLHNRLSVFYADGTKIVYDNYIIDDEGNIASVGLFSGISGSSDYQNQILNFNYQQKVSATEFGGRSINLVIDPRIGTLSGLIQ